MPCLGGWDLTPRDVASADGVFCLPVVVMDGVLLLLGLQMFAVVSWLCSVCCPLLCDVWNIEMARPLYSAWLDPWILCGPANVVLVVQNDGSSRSVPFNWVKWWKASSCWLDDNNNCISYILLVCIITFILVWLSKLKMAQSLVSYMNATRYHERTLPREFSFLFLGSWMCWGWWLQKLIYILFKLLN